MHIRQYVNTYINVRFRLPDEEEGEEANELTAEMCWPQNRCDGHDDDV